MSETSTETLLATPNKELSTLHPRTSSLGSLNNFRKQKTSSSNVYKQASSLFLTRRLSEALDTLEPLILAPDQPSPSSDEERQCAPIAKESRNLRIKVWSLYLTLLDTIIELGPDEGKNAFGSTKWKSILNKACDGTIWEEVVYAGYGGIEENVDAEVIINL